VSHISLVFREMWDTTDLNLPAHREVPAWSRSARPADWAKERAPSPRDHLLCAPLLDQLRGHREMGGRQPLRDDPLGQPAPAVDRNHDCAIFADRSPARVGSSVCSIKFSVGLPGFRCAHSPTTLRVCSAAASSSATSAATWLASCVPRFGGCQLPHGRALLA
jgi:hypothetical protein